MQWEPSVLLAAFALLSASIFLPRAPRVLAESNNFQLWKKAADVIVGVDVVVFHGGFTAVKRRSAPLCYFLSFNKKLVQCASHFTACKSFRRDRHLGYHCTPCGPESGRNVLLQLRPLWFNTNGPIVQ